MGPRQQTQQPAWDSFRPNKPRRRRDGSEEGSSSSGSDDYKHAFLLYLESMRVYEVGPSLAEVSVEG